MNRDYFSKPIQGTRSSYDYGNTQISRDKNTSYINLGFYMLLVGGAIYIIANLV